MIPLAMIVGDELGDGSPKVTLAEWNEAVEAFLLGSNGQTAPRTHSHSARDGRSYNADPGFTKRRADRCAPLRIPVGENEDATLTRVGHRQCSRDLSHERFIRMRR